MGRCMKKVEKHCTRGKTTSRSLTSDLLSAIFRAFSHPLLQANYIIYFRFYEGFIAYF